MSDVTLMNEAQSKLLDLLRQHREDSDNTGYPAVIDPYGGQLRNPRQIRNLPAVYVDVPGRFEIEAQSSSGGLWDFNGDPEIVFFCENSASPSDTRKEVADLVDWILGAIKEQILNINSVPIPIDRVTGRIVTDYDDKIAAGVLTIPLTAFDN